MSFSSDELNYLIYRYMKEAGFEHSAFTFGNESRVAVDRIPVAPSDVLPGTMVYIVQKGLQYLEVEATVTDDGQEVELEEPISLLTPYSVKKRSNPESQTKTKQDGGKKRKRTLSNGKTNQQQTAGNSIIEEEAKEKESKKTITTKPTTTKPTTMPSTPTPTTSTITNVQIPQSQVTTLEGHTSEVFMCSWNPKFSIIASGSADNTARYWTIPEGPSGKKSADEAMKSSLVLKHIHNSHESKDVTTIDWNNSGTYLATGTLDGIARIWDLKGNCKFKLDKHDGAIFSLKWSKSGEYLLSGSVDHSAIVWDTNTGTIKQQFQFHSLATLDVDWKNENTFASCSSDQTIYICQLGLNTPLRKYQAHEDEVNAIRWSPDGRILASCSDDKTAKIWSLDQEQPLYDLTDHTKEIYTIKWSPTGPGTKNPNANVILASASFDSTVKLWDVEHGKCIQTLFKHSDPVYSVAFSPDGQYVASGSIDRYIHIYSVKDGKHLKTYRGNGGIFEVCWNNSGDKVAACFSNNVVCILDFKM